jgi:hypothetical protein
LVSKTDIAEIAERLRVELYAALNELSEYDPRKFEAATEEYLASFGAGPATDGDKVDGDKN